MKYAFILALLLVLSGCDDNGDGDSDSGTTPPPPPLPEGQIYGFTRVEGQFCSCTVADQSFVVCEYAEGTQEVSDTGACAELSGQSVSGYFVVYTEDRPCNADIPNCTEPFE